MQGAAGNVEYQVGIHMVGLGLRGAGEREREGRLGVLTTAFNHFERPDWRCKIQLELTAVLSVLIPLLEFCMKMYF